MFWDFENSENLEYLKLPKETRFKREKDKKKRGSREAGVKKKREIKLQKFSSFTHAGHKIAVPAEDQFMPRGSDAHHLAAHADSLFSQVHLQNH